MRLCWDMHSTGQAQLRNKPTAPIESTKPGVVVVPRARTQHCGAWNQHRGARQRTERWSGSELRAPQERPFSVLLPPGSPSSSHGESDAEHKHKFKFVPNGNAVKDFHAAARRVAKGVELFSSSRVRCIKGVKPLCCRWPTWHPRLWHRIVPNSVTITSIAARSAKTTVQSKEGERNRTNTSIASDKMQPRRLTPLIRPSKPNSRIHRQKIVHGVALTGRISLARTTNGNQDAYPL
jgi:hypothetical protein